MILIAIVVVFIVIIGAILILPGRREDHIEYPVEVGYFLKYNCTGGQQNWIYNDGNYTPVISYDHNSTCNLTYDILNVSGELVDYRYSSPQGDDFQQNISKDYTYFAMIPDHYFSSPYVLLTRIGNETIETKWGEISTEHFSINDVHHGWSECWIFNGILIKYESVSFSGSVIALTLLDANIPRLTGLKN